MPTEGMFGTDAIHEDVEMEFSSGASTPETMDEYLHAPGGVTTMEKDLNSFEMTVNHSKLLILISKYATCALSAEDNETWMRELPLQVMIYEGIASGKLDFDYSPQSVFVGFDGSTRRIFINISQEGKAAIDDLREQKLINGLKISTEDFHPITAYQASVKGLQFLKTLPNTLFDQVNSFVYAPNAPHYDTELLECSFDGETFELKTKSGFTRQSEVSVIEDVSYVSSPYLPVCLRSGRAKPLTDNAHRANECSAGADNLRDELSEAIKVSYVSLVVGEWVPFGSNNMLALNERLGALERCQGGLFTAAVDKNPTSTNFKVPPGLTSVNIIDFKMDRFTNFESEINFPEEKGIIQIEHFGMHINVDGTVLNGVKLEAVMDRTADNVSLDLLSRVLVDIQLDSSRIMDDLLTGYQRSLLDMIFMGDNANRNKFNCILADHIHPKLEAKNYNVRGEMQNELKQVLGDIYLAEDIGRDDVIIIGRDGLLLAGPHAGSLEELAMFYTALMCRELFVRNYFIRTFMLNDTLKKIRRLIEHHETDPENIKRIRLALSEASGDIILLEETLSYLRESLDDLRVPDLPHDPKAKRLYRIFNCGAKSDVIRSSVFDLAKLIAGAANQLENLQQVTDVINTKQLERIYFQVESNTKILVDASAANERAGAALSVMQVVLTGSFSFSVLDHISATMFNAWPAEWFTVYVLQPFVNPPGIFFVTNMLWLGCTCYCLIRYMRFLKARASGSLTLRIKVNKKLHSMVALHQYITTKHINMTDAATEPTSSVKRVTWQERDDDKWMGSSPVIEMTYDSLFHFVLVLTYTIDRKRSNATEEDLVNILLLDFVKVGAMEKEVAFGSEGGEEEVREATQSKDRKDGKGFFSRFRSG